MDEERLEVALILVVIAACVFSLFLLKKFLSVMRFSAKAILCLAALAVFAALIWSKRFSLDEQSGELPRSLERVSLSR